MKSKTTSAALAGKIDSRQAILAAAVDEFAERGFYGARMEGVARRAGCNKALVYRYFTDRETLFQKALSYQLDDRRKLADAMPPDLGDMLAAWALDTTENPSFTKLILRENLDDDAPTDDTKERRDYYGALMMRIEDLKSAGELPKPLDTEIFLLAMLSMISLPAVLPHSIETLTGFKIDDRQFQKKWEKFIRNFATILTSAAKAEE